MQKKYSKLSMGSFILSLIPLLLFLKRDYFVSNTVNSQFVFLTSWFLIGAILIFSIIFGVMSLKQNKKKNLQGNLLAVIGIIISILLLAIILFSISVSYNPA